MKHVKLEFMFLFWQTLCNPIVPLQTTPACIFSIEERGGVLTVLTPGSRLAQTTPRPTALPVTTHDFAQSYYSFVTLASHAI